MKLKVLLPTGVLADEEVRKVSVEAVDGAMTLLDGHIDIATEIVPGVMTYEPTAGGEKFVAVAEGVLVKCGDELLVSTRKGVIGTQLGELRDLVEKQLSEADEHELTARTALNKIEATFVHRFIELEHGG